MAQLNADGLYISSNNRSLALSKYRKSNYKVIGSAHNLKELNLKFYKDVLLLFFQDYLKLLIKIKKTSWV